MSLAIKLIGLHQRAAVLALFLPLLAGPPAVAQTGDVELSIPWKQGLMEVVRYSIKSEGLPVGEVEQRIYGAVNSQGKRQYRVMIELVRSFVEQDGAPSTGHSSKEIIFEPGTLNLIERIENVTSRDVEARLHITRTPTGVTIEKRVTAEGVPHEPEYFAFDYKLKAGLLVDPSIYVYYIRSLPDAEVGRKFDLTTVYPLAEGTQRHRTQVGRLQIINWNGQDTEVRRIDDIGPDGVGTYFVQPGGSRLLLRHVSPTGDIFDMQPGDEAGE